MDRMAALACALVLVPAAIWAAEPAARKLRAVPFTDVRISDQFWAPRIETNRTRTIPYQFTQCEETGRIRNFDKAAGKVKGDFEGIFFNDSDVYKAMEAAAFSLAAHPDPELQRQLDSLVDRVAAAQQKDGYLFCFYTLKEPEKRWTNLKDMHELYCAGHLIEAAVAHFRATGKRTLLDVAIRLADHIDSIFGPDKRHGTSGHEEIELALVKLYEVTAQERYLRLAKFFLDERGHTACGRKLYGPYHQDHMPVIQQVEPVGHAVRAMYLYCGMADVAGYLDAPGYLDALQRLWASVVTQKMYLTGGVGARHQGEAFGDPYELPNESAYCETCAAIGFAFWNHRMNLLHGDARYADVLERALYNGILSGVSLDGQRFFYVNPLASAGKHHRQPWFGCACCPPNVARIIPAVPGYVYASDDDGIYVNLYVGSSARVARKGGQVGLVQETRYPWDGNVRISLSLDSPDTFTLGLRVPEWTRPGDQAGGLYRAEAVADEKPVTIRVNGQAVIAPTIERGYAVLRREWRKGDIVEIEMPMPVRRVYAHPQVAADAGRVALQRGPVVYCIEAADNGKHLPSVFLPPDAPVQAEHRPDLLGGVTVLKARAMVRTDDASAAAPTDLVAVPYHVWDHRAPGPMVVWIPEKAEAARPLPRPTIATESRASASHVWHADTADALNDGLEPKNSSDHDIPRMTWWDHRGTAEWVQYDFARPAKVASVEVYWFDDTGRGQCRVPKSWRVLYRAGDQWRPVEGASAAGVEKDRYNRVTFTPVETTGLRLEVELQPGFSGGILEWRVGAAE